MNTFTTVSESQQTILPPFSTFRNKGPLFLGAIGKLNVVNLTAVSLKQVIMMLLVLHFWCLATVFKSFLQSVLLSQPISCQQVGTISNENTIFQILHTATYQNLCIKCMIT